MASIDQVSQIVTQIAEAEEPASVTNTMVSTVLQFFVSFYNSANPKFTEIEREFTSVGKSIESSKQSFFRAMWNEICSGSWMATDWQNPVGRYNNETGYYELNGLTDITYGEAIRIFASWVDGRSQAGRANLPPWRTRGLNHKETNMKESAVESWWGCNSAVSGQTMGTDPGNCGGSTNLKTMKFVNLTNILTGDGNDVGDVRQLDNCPALVHVDFNRIEQSVIWIRSSPKLDAATLRQLFTMSPIGATIHLNKTAYNNINNNGAEFNSYITGRNLTVTSNY